MPCPSRPSRLAEDQVRPSVVDTGGSQDEINRRAIFTGLDNYRVTPRPETQANQSRHQHVGPSAPLHPPVLLQPHPISHSSAGPHPPPLFKDK
ncbi:hypothetical protein C0Q70_16488 [Pomacea canaliculata]|uniref:Uncharacterized protein n=1 Tax=Pomacea canaliculata TaxID=400727 RepID=A0A2T7NPX6_POMCA|nr:hypothetical protein C0Q70_16488 [Pomacea canaliculata]